jgi:hypothetical protein
VTLEAACVCVWRLGLRGVTSSTRIRGWRRSCSRHALSWSQTASPTLSRHCVAGHRLPCSGFTHIVLPYLANFLFGQHLQVSSLPQQGTAGPGWRLCVAPGGGKRAVGVQLRGAGGDRSQLKTIAELLG